MSGQGNHVRAGRAIITTAEVSNRSSAPTEQELLASTRPEWRLRAIRRLLFHERQREEAMASLQVLATRLDANWANELWAGCERDELQAENKTGGGAPTGGHLRSDGGRGKCSPSGSG